MVELALAERVIVTVVASEGSSTIGAESFRLGRAMNPPVPSVEEKLTRLVCGFVPFVVRLIYPLPVVTFTHTAMERRWPGKQATDWVRVPALAPAAILAE
jgi:hypothetical protein